MNANDRTSTRTAIHVDGRRTGSRALTVAFTAAVLTVALLAGLLAASAAHAAGVVRVTTALPEPDVGEPGVDVSPPLLALYVDSSGAAHVAWVASGDQTIDLCTIPPRGGSCGNQTTLATDANAANGGEIASIKYLPNDSGGPAYLAVGIDQMNPPPAIDRFSLDPGIVEELFALGQSAGLTTGEVAYISDGGVILEPDGTGVDVVGDSQTGTGCCYEFEPLTPGAQGSGVISLANPNQNQNLIDITKLPQGQTAAISSLSTVGPIDRDVRPDRRGRTVRSAPAARDHRDRGGRRVRRRQLCAQCRDGFEDCDRRHLR